MAAAQRSGALPQKGVVVHLAKRFAADLGDVNRGGHFGPSKYAATLCNSIFTLCPEGKSIEQHRIYEAGSSVARSFREKPG